MHRGFHLTISNTGLTEIPYQQLEFSPFFKYCIYGDENGGGRLVLSNNNISEITPHRFASLSEYTPCRWKLDLSENPIRRIGSFALK